VGANIKRIQQLPNGTMAWSIGVDEYVDTNTLVTGKATLESEGMTLKGKASKPLQNGCCPLMNVSPECNAVMTQRYQVYIGILCWALELGCFDVVLEVSLMSSFNALPREGHLEALYHMLRRLPTFRSEFVAMRQATQLIEALRYKLRMFGILIDASPTTTAARVYGDKNGAVISNSSIPTPTLTKKHNAICYHRVSEAVAAGTTASGKVHTDYNVADLFTKQLSCS